MINIKFLDDKENSLICSQSKTSRKNSFSMNNGKFFKDKSDSKENRLSELENDKSKKNIQIYNCKLNEILFQYNNNTEKDYFDTNFFMCMKYIYYKNNFKKKYKMGIAENCVYNYFYQIILNIFHKIF
jgi:peroxiredoxin family protein